jgi:molecular chaperone DnaK
MAVFGIDFGTTTSGAVQLVAGQPIHDGDETGRPLPSIVVIDRVTGEAFGGRKAWNDRFELEQNGNFFVIPSIKTLLASDRQWPTNGRLWTPTDVAAYLFEQLNEKATRRAVRSGITHATVAIPVGMPASARRVLRAAAARIGIEIDSFVSESTAAVFRYFEEYKHLHRVVVFDWGGGTLDISVLEFRSTGVFEIGLSGSPTAGNALDSQIALYLHGRIMQSRERRRSFEEMDPHDQTRLVFEAEELKRKLLGSPSAPVSLMNYGGKDVSVTVHRDELAPVLKPAVAEAIALLEATIHRAGLSIDGVDAILLVGGSSQLWLLQQELSVAERFKGRYRIAEAPEWDVAHGAALLNNEAGAYELAETLALRLSDGSSVDLVRPGDRPGGDSRTLSLVLTEDVPEAHIVIDRRASGDLQSRPALQFSTPSLGFLEEEISLNYRLTSDLTFVAAAASSRRPTEPAREREIEDLRFGYSLAAVKA